MRIVLASAFLIAALAACAGRTAIEATDSGADASEGFAASDPLATDASLGTRASEVFVGCGGGAEASCHSVGAGGTYLRLGESGDLVGVPSSEDPSLLRVKPGSPAESYLWWKLLPDGGYDGGRMPLGGPFDPRLAPFVAQWIEAGAPSQ